jgi:hypothetical protein
VVKKTEASEQGAKESMTDIDNHSYGRDASPWADIRTGLTEVERRLSQLQDQLDPRSPATAGFDRAVATSDFARQTVGVSAGMGGLAFDPAAAAPTDTAGIGFGPSSLEGDPVAARRGAEAILAQARAGASEVLATAEARVGMVKEQIEQLLLARETLRKSLRTALVECESSLQRLECGEQPVHPSDLRAAAGGSISGHGEQPSAERSVALSDALGIQTTTARFAAQPPEVFEGSVSLRVGPLRDISQVDTLEIALLQVPGAERVEVKEFAGRDAVAQIKLFQPVPLVEELRRVLPFQFEVADGGSDSLTLIAVEDGDTGRLDTENALPQVGGE